MSKNVKRYYTLDRYHREIYQCKVYKLALDLGGTCPNRDGSKGVGGCVFCRNGGATAFASPDIDAAIAALHAKKTDRYIVYYQTYTGLYPSPERLKAHAEQALSRSDVVGISIATRPDCLGDSAMEALAELATRTRLSVELGLQTVSDKTAALINRGYSYKVFESAFLKLRAYGIRVCVHIMNGLPEETADDMLNTARVVGKLEPSAVKLHSVFVAENTPLAQLYRSGKYTPIARDEYIQVVCGQLRLLPADTVVERLTGDGERKFTLAPEWTLNKRAVLNGIDREMAENGYYQGDLYEKYC